MRLVLPVLLAVARGPLGEDCDYVDLALCGDYLRASRGQSPLEAAGDPGPVPLGRGRREPDGSEGPPSLRRVLYPLLLFLLDDHDGLRLQQLREREVFAPSQARPQSLEVLGALALQCGRR